MFIMRPSLMKKQRTRAKGITLSVYFLIRGNDSDLQQYNM